MAGTGDRAGLKRTGILGVNTELNAGAISLVCAAFIECAACFEALRPGWQIECDDAIRVRADAVVDSLPRAAQ